MMDVSIRCLRSLCAIKQRIRKRPTTDRILNSARPRTSSPKRQQETKQINLDKEIHNTARLTTTSAAFYKYLDRSNRKQRRPLVSRVHRKKISQNVPRWSLFDEATTGYCLLAVSTTTTRYGVVFRSCRGGGRRRPIRSLFCPHFLPHALLF